MSGPDEATDLEIGAVEVSRLMPGPKTEIKAIVVQK